LAIAHSKCAPSSISFGDASFIGCDRLIELADAAGFPSTVDSDDEEEEGEFSTGDGVILYLLHQLLRSETNSAAPSVHKWVFDERVENYLNSGALRRSLRYEGLSDGFVELYLRYPNLTAIGWDGIQAFPGCDSLLRVDLSGCPIS